MTTVFYTAEEVASILRFTDRTVKNLAEKGEIPGGRRIGREWRFDKAALEQHLGRELPDPKQKDVQ